MNEVYPEFVLVYRKKTGGKDTRSWSTDKSSHFDLNLYICQYWMCTWHITKFGCSASWIIAKNINNKNLGQKHCIQVDQVAGEPHSSQVQNGSKVQPTGESEIFHSQISNIQSLFFRTSQRRSGKLRLSQILTWLKRQESFLRSPLSMSEKRWFVEDKEQDRRRISFVNVRKEVAQWRWDGHWRKL